MGDQYFFKMPLPVEIDMEWSRSSETEGDASYEVTEIYTHFPIAYGDFQNEMEIKV